MSLPSTRLRLAMTSVALCALATPIAASALPTEGTAAPAGGTPTNPREAAKVDSVDVSTFAWAPCEGLPADAPYDCATVTVPMDYDEPQGDTVDLAVLRHRARNPEKRIGSLFMNPGGPGGSGVRIAAAAPRFLKADLLDSFDIVGMDPRGIAGSDAVQCFANSAEQQKAIADMNGFYPTTSDELMKYFYSAKKLGRACANTPMASSMSTAQVSRDMDVVRRAVGDDKLSYLGFSYGTELGQTYAAMFPDRIRAMVVDGVLDPLTWLGPKKLNMPTMTERVDSAEGAERAFAEILKRCAEAGDACPITGGESPQDAWLQVRTYFAENPTPASIVIPRYGPDPIELVLNESSVTTLIRGMLYSNVGAGESAAALVQSLWTMIPGNADGVDAAAAKAKVERLAGQSVGALRSTLAADEQYNNGLEAFYGVLCSDGRQPGSIFSSFQTANAAKKANPNFGPVWAWGSVGCARDTWFAKDTDDYEGPFDATTSAPLLFVGNTFDPATNVNNAIRSSKRQPGASLIVSDNWGHLAYGTSSCVDDAVSSYLFDPRAMETLKCTGDYQPFAATNRRSVETGNELGMIVPATPWDAAPTLLGLGALR